MTKLTSDQLKFLKRIGIGTNETFDATGLNRSEWQSQMKILKKSVAYGVAPCKLMGHSLKTRHGHCAQCNPENFSYQKRKTENGDVYVAWSKNFKVVKIGVSKNAYLREKTLNKSKYAGISDWEMKLIYECQNIGEIETLTKNELLQFLITDTKYNNGNTERTSTEIYSCSLKKAMTTLEKIVFESHAAS